MTIIVMVMPVRIALMHRVPVASCVICKHGRTACLLDHVRGQTPKDDGYAALTVLLIFGEGINSMLPVYIHISSEGEQHAICLREIDLIS
jgi:hypothetical protein